MNLLNAISTTWPLEAVSVQPIGGGINNRTFRLQTTSGGYILRLYPSSAQPEMIAFETRVLAELARADLPFQVPAPLRSRAGEAAPTIRFHQTEETDATEARAMVTAVIPGAARQPESLAQAESAGAALGALTRAMSGISPTGTPVGYGDLEHINPLLPDPVAAASLPMITPEESRRLTRLLEGIIRDRNHWYRTLPMQVIHGDYVPFNILMLGDTVSAVLDFELACYDPRALDFATGFWPWLMWREDTDWAMADAFAAAYTRHQTFTPAEAEALPFLLRLRRAGSLLWWAGKYLQGTAAGDGVRWNVASALRLEDWLEANQGELLRRASGWVRA